MGNVFSSTTLAPMAVRLAWICQMLLDPKYSYIEDSERQIARPPALPEPSDTVDEAPLLQELPAATSTISTISTSTSTTLGAAAHRLSENGSLHQENRKRRAAQLRFKNRPSSFDAALIVRKNKNSLVVTSMPNTLRRGATLDVSSSSGCSSDSSTNSDADSETELRVSEGSSNTNLGVSAEEEEAFRLTLGRGYFSRSKKDCFLNHLRLEKRLNDLNNDYLSIACKNHHRQTLQRRHSGDLHRIC